MHIESMLHISDVGQRELREECQTATNEGHVAFHKDRRLENNPYDNGLSGIGYALWAAWRMGWFAAKDNVRILTDEKTKNDILEKETKIHLINTTKLEIYRDIKNARARGNKAYHDKVNFHDNPYKHLNGDDEAWRLGWLEAHMASDKEEEIISNNDVAEKLFELFDAIKEARGA